MSNLTAENLTLTDTQYQLEQRNEALLQLLYKVRVELVAVLRDVVEGGEVEGNRLKKWRQASRALNGVEANDAVQITRAAECVQTVETSQAVHAH